ncbi:MAG: hypothetical protein R6W86_09735 [Marinobacter sp.]|uniref:hypothetical protein n=1 Tax=Marinobacter sp. TaxID=50741 RepID=UPI00396E591B
MNKTDLVFQSYGRCCRKDDFFVDFYDFFMSGSDTIRNRFLKTDMDAQRHLLRNGIVQLILHARTIPTTRQSWARPGVTS